jgi:hypothetical protein
MKKTLLLMAAVVAMACSCDGEKDCIPCQKEDQAEATLAVNLDLEDDAQTKATAYVTAQPYETAINDVQVLVFDSSGALNAYVDADTKTSGINIKTTTGSKTICAVVNGPDLSSVTTIPELNAKTIDLGDNSITSTAGFVMAGSTSCNVSTSSQNVNVTVRRFVSRVALQKVNNALPASYGAMTINNVTLINVVGNQNLAGAATASTWYNKMGRKDGATASNQIIDGSTYLASHPTLTFKSVESSVASGASHTPTTPYLFYTFPNSTSNDVTGWATSFTARKTRLVVAATIGGKKYYYPVVIDTPSRNNAYTVELTITGLGSTEPDKPVEKGTINASVTVEGWATGSIYNETI